MTTKELPEPKCYTVEQLAKKWGCAPEDILHYGRTGQLTLSVLSEGWWIEYANLEGDEGNEFYNFLFDEYSSGQLLRLSASTARHLLKNGFVNNPPFYFKDYDCAGISSDRHKTGVVVKVADIVIDPINILEFEALFLEQQHNGMAPPLTSERPQKNSKLNSGPKPVKKENIKQDILGKLKAGSLTVQSLTETKQENLANEYGVSRETAVKARDAAIKEYQQK